MTTFNVHNQNSRRRRAVVACLTLLVFGALFLYVFVLRPQLVELNLRWLKQRQQLNANTSQQLDSTSTQQTESTTQQPVDDRLVTVSTSDGPITGQKVDRFGQQTVAFLGVPYAKAPDPSKPFARPQPTVKRTTPLLALSQPAACLQPNYTQSLFPVTILNSDLSLDCLKLNVWTPTTNKSAQLAVLVFLHGGLFTVGSIGLQEYDGHALSSVGEVVVVTVQYRLGLFGFFDLNATSVEGNAGLFDQQMALIWLQQNVEFFGGDPNKVTLFGQSAGAVAIGLHALAPGSRRLFRRAILQSGSSLLMDDVFSKGRDASWTLAEQANCAREEDDEETVAKCVNSLGVSRLLELQQEHVRGNPVPFMPTLPSDFLETMPSQAVASDFLQQDFLLGFNSDDGNLMLHLVYPEKFTRKSVPEYLNTLQDARQVLANLTAEGGLRKSHAQALADVLITGNETDSSFNWTQKLGAAVGDLLFVCPTLELAERLTNGDKRVHLYLFSHRKENSAWGTWLGATHHDEVEFVFGAPLNEPTKFGGADLDLSKRMIEVWATFAKTGSVPPQLGVSWPEFGSSGQFMELRADRATVGRRFHERACNLYNALVEYLQ